MAVFFNNTTYMPCKMQRQLSSFDIYVIVSDLQELIGCHIEKIYQLTRDELLIRVKNIETKEKQQLFIRNGELICTTQKQLEKPSKPSTFAMTLRKYLLNGKITEILQHEFDRIIKLKINKKEGEYTLVIEFFSDGNIILGDPNEKIILPLVRQSWAHRKIKGREQYVSPPSQINPFDLNKDRFIELLKESNADIVRTLAVNLNLSGPISEEVCFRANIDKKTKIEEIDDITVSKTFEALTNFLNIFKEKKFEPVVVKKDGIIVDVLPFKFESYTNVDFEKVDSMTKSLEEFIKIKKVGKKIESKSDKLLGKLKRQLVQQEETIKKLETQIKEKKLEGDLIYLNYQELEILLSEISQVLDLKDKEDAVKKINEKDIVKEFDPNRKHFIVYLKDTDGNRFEVKLSFRKSVSDNAQKAYADHKKFRSKLNGAKKSILKTREQIGKALKDEQLVREQEEKKVEKTEKTFWFERYRWFISSDGNIVVGGRDAKTNEHVVKKYLKAGDRYAHADIQGAPSIIIKSKNVKDEEIIISEKTLEEACIFAASYSKAWKQFAEAQAYWVLPEQVSKTAESGEFVPKGAFIIRGKRNYHRCKLEVAVGLIDISGERKVMGGPVDAIKKRSSKYVILVPGGTKKSDTARSIAKSFDVNVDNVDRVIPPGGVTVVETVGVEL
jgi:predicted ribosome quality control (RQC) complex YloA/Tae2 family protein